MTTRSALQSILLFFLLSHQLLFAQQSARGLGRTLQSFGVRVERGLPARPYPANVALGLFNPEDSFLDVAYYGEGEVQVFQNLGNGLLSDEPVFERSVTSEVVQMQWRMTNPYLRSPSDLVITYENGSEETITNERMVQQSMSFAWLPQTTNTFPPLNFVERWRSAANPGLSTQVAIGDIDDDGSVEMVYFFYPAVGGDSARRLVVYECVGDDSFVVDWDTTVTTLSGVFCIADIDNDGHKEIVTGYNPRGMNILPTIALLECFGPRQYRFYNTNIGVQRPGFKVMETDINHNGRKELCVLGSDPNAFDPTLIYVAEFVSKGQCTPSPPHCPSGWFMVFNQELARYPGYAFDMAIGQVDGMGRDEIIPAGGSFGAGEPVPVFYLWYSGIPGAELWKVRGIRTGLQSGTAAVMFVNLDSDTAMEFVSGAPGPIGNGSMFTLDYVSDTTWRVMWADSSLRNSPLWVNAGMLSGQRVVAGANTYQPNADTTRSWLNIYTPSGERLGVWFRDSASIQQFHLVDIDRDGRTNLIFSLLGDFPYRFLVDYENDTVVVGVNDQDEVPQRIELFQNFPNPFNPSTRIRFYLSRREKVTLSIYDVLGRVVTTLLNEEKEVGKHEVQWDALRYSSGVYIYKLETSSGILVRKMILEK